MAKKKKWRKLLAVTLAASMVLGLANMSSLVAIAAGEGESTIPLRTSSHRVVMWPKLMTQRMPHWMRR